MCTHSSVGVIKDDLKVGALNNIDNIIIFNFQETERLLDLLEGAKLKKRVDQKVQDKLEQKLRLKNMLLSDTLPLKK